MSSARRPWWRQTVRLIGWSTLFLAALAASVYFVMRAQVGPVSDAIGAAAEVAKAQPIVISKVTHFEWDELWVFGPYSDKDEVCRRLALNGLRCTFQVKEDFLSDGVQSLVFRLRGSVVHSELHARSHGDFYPTPPNQPLTPSTAVFDVFASGISTAGDPWRILRLHGAKYENKTGSRLMLLTSDKS